MNRVVIIAFLLCGCLISRGANPSYQAFKTNNGFGITPSGDLVVLPGYIGSNTASPITNITTLTGFVSGSGSNTIPTTITTSGSNYVYDMIGQFGVNPTNGVTSNQVVTISSGLINQSNTMFQPANVNLTNWATVPTNVLGASSAVGGRATNLYAGTNYGGPGNAFISTSGTNRVWIYPTNAFEPLVLPGGGGYVRISKTNTSVDRSLRITTPDAGGFNGVLIGDQLAIGANQYRVVDIDNTTHTNLTVFEYSPNNNFLDTTNYDFYPTIFFATDINKAPTAWFGSDGHVGVVSGPGTSGGKWCYGVGWYAKTNTIFAEIADESLTRGPRWRLQSGWPSALGGGDPFGVAIRAPYESLAVQDDGLVAMRFGFTNIFATDLDYWVSIITHSQTTNGSGLQTASVGSRVFSNSTATVSGLLPGDCLVITNSTYNIIRVPNSSMILTHVPTTTGASDSPWRLIPATQRSFNETPSTATYQNILGFGAFCASGEGGVFLHESSTSSNVWLMTAASSLAGGDSPGNWALRPANGNSPPVVLVDQRAGFESLRVMRNGLVSASYGLTNGFGGFITNYSDVLDARSTYTYGTNYTRTNFPMPIVQAGTTNVSLAGAAVTINFARYFQTTNYTAVLSAVGGATLFPPASKTISNMTTIALTFVGNLDWSATEHTQ